MERQEELKAIVAESALAETDATALIGDFTEAVRVAAEWEESAKTLTVTDDSQVDLMLKARSARLELREKRLAVTAKHKELKESSLRRGQALDKIKRFVLGLIEPIEKFLEDQEKFVERKQAAEEAERVAKAEALLKAQEEAERKEKEAEEKRIREENERLKKEAAEREAAIAAERVEREKAERMRLAEERREHEEERRLIAEEQARKDAAARAEADKKAREAAEEARKDAEARAKVRLDQMALEAKERERLLRLVTCPECGHTFDSAEAKAHE